MSKIADVEANATSLDGLVNDNALIPTLRNGPKPSYQYLVDGWNAEIAQAILEMNKSRGFRVVGTFADGFTYELFNDVGIDANGDSWIYVGAGAPDKVVAAGTLPGVPDYEQVSFNDASGVLDSLGTNVQDYINGNLTPFKTVAEMKSASFLSTLPEFTRVEWQGYYAQSDDGSNWGVLRFGAHVEDGGSVFSIDINTYVDANLNGNSINAAMFGVTTSNAANLKDFVTYCWTNSKIANIASGSYSISEQIANVTAPCLASLVCENGVAELTYIGADLDRLFFAEQADNVIFNNVTINASDLVAAPIDIRKNAGIGGVCAILNTKTKNSKQVGAIATNPSGILVSGEYSVVDIINSDVENVTYIDPARSSTGIGVIQFTGKANIINSNVANILTPSGVDADGIKVFGKEFSAGSEPTTGKALIKGCTLHDCQGRAVKMQVRDWEATGNTVSLSDGFETITEWRGFDGQDGGGNVHGNDYEFGVGVVFGSAAKLVQFSSSRNDGVSKVSRFEKNKVDSKTAGLSLIAGINISYGEHVIVIDENVYRGATISRGVQFRAQEGVANIDSVVIKCRDNDFVDLTNQDLFLPFDAVDFGDKLFLEFTGNDVQNKASLSRFYNSLAGFSVNNNFKVNNNVAVTDRIDWPFDMNGLPGGNSFLFATQTIDNIAGGIGTFGYVVTDGSIQRTFSNSVAVEARRADGGVWVTV